MLVEQTGLREVLKMLAEKLQAKKVTLRTKTNEHNVRLLRHQFSYTTPPRRVMCP